MPVRPAQHAARAERRAAGEPPRHNRAPWPQLTVGAQLRRLIAAARSHERSSTTLRRLS